MPRASVISESRVMPGRMVPVSGGVCSEPSSKTKKTFMPPSSSTQRRSTASRNTTCSQPRSEEHTSELQSLIRISYAVFCLKKKQNTQTLELQHTSIEHCYSLN